MTAHPSIDDARRRGRQLALSLVDLGEDEATTERQLIRWRFHPGLARECVRWALAARADSASGVHEPLAPTAPSGSLALAVKA